ncbi:MAG: AraC family transcriptional regulator [Paenibacillaceae bacterium]|nr:AraC family transcriptional regulator [Paenibacillaceae bacterium]
MDRLTRSSLRENRNHGDESFPLVAYWISQGPGKVVLDCHWHEEAEFFYVLEGETLFHVDAECFPVRAGEAVFIDGGDIHAGHTLGGSSCSFCAVVFDLRFLSSFGDDAVQKHYVTPLQIRTRTFPRHIRPDSDWERNILHSLRAIISACSGQHSGFQAAVKGHFYLMLNEIAQANRWADRSSAGSAEAKVDRLKKVILHMQAHYNRQIPVRELADLIPMSEGQFCRFFKSMTRQTPIEYLNTYRITRANELLRSTDRKIADIAMEVGFGHISYFIKVYRKVMNVPPSRFRMEVEKSRLASVIEHL